MQVRILLKSPEVRYELDHTAELPTIWCAHFVSSLILILLCANLSDTIQPTLGLMWQI